MAEVKGILGEKLGMTQIFDDARAVPVTVIKAGPCHVAQIKTVERDGYSALQLAFGNVSEKRVNKPEKGHFDKHGGDTAKHVVELRTDDVSGYTEGQSIGVDIFEAGEKADVVGVSKGKGFAGVMKRHGFAGLGASHGTHRVHRSPGSVGACATPSRVFKGIRGPGRMGGKRVTQKGLEVVEVVPEQNLLLVRGSVPGARGGTVEVRTDA